MATSQAKKDGKVKKMPVRVIRPGNGISLAIYEDTIELKSGQMRTVYSATIRKTYRTSENEWEHVQTLYPSDFLMAALAYQEAYRWVLEAYQSKTDAGEETEK
jgi:CRISPR/Cas system CSM-associated protein Csm2 small subunit